MNLRPLRAALAVAAVYGYFLIFAQFSFVELLRAGGVGSGGEKLLLGLMAIAGIGGGFLTAWRGPSSKWIRGSLVVAGLAAVLSTTSPGMAGFAMAALMTGMALGVATVGLAALLPAWCGLGWLGLGTGLAYAGCNLPWIFTSAPVDQAWIGVMFAMAGALVVPSSADWKAGPSDRVVTLPFWMVVVVFTALVWMDSAAFFIIQHSGDLKSGTWGTALLWRNAVVHLVLACVSGFWLARGGARALPSAAWILLAVAALMVNEAATRGIAGWFYPAGVSLYSVALVAWPGWFSGAVGSREAAWRAAWLFAIAGWFGSANGIGMAQSLEHVPVGFVAAAGAVLGGMMLLSKPGTWRLVVAMGVVALAVWLGGRQVDSGDASASKRGRDVYISEGCIHCHSQYVRPGSADEEIWGPARRVEDVLNGEPVLIGNRRQGPDLSNVGARRSEAWLKAHFMNPRELVPDSAMPSYAHLFTDSRGADLVAYLKESGVAAMGDVLARAAKWEPSSDVVGSNGAQLFSANCAVCHGAEGAGDGPLAGSFTRPPANLVAGPFVWTAPDENLKQRVARVVKFGIVGTDMPGHEVLTDEQVNALVVEVLRFRRK